MVLFFSPEIYYLQL